MYLLEKSRGEKNREDKQEWEQSQPTEGNDVTFNPKP